MCTRHKLHLKLKTKRSGRWGLQGGEDSADAVCIILSRVKPHIHHTQQKTTTNRAYTFCCISLNPKETPKEGKFVLAEETLIISPFCKNQRKNIVVIRFSKYLGNIKEKYFQMHCHFHHPLSACQMSPNNPFYVKGHCLPCPHFRSVLIILSLCFSDYEVPTLLNM